MIRLYERYKIMSDIPELDRGSWLLEKHKDKHKKMRVISIYFLSLLPDAYMFNINYVDYINKRGFLLI